MHVRCYLPDHSCSSHLKAGLLPCMVFACSVMYQVTPDQHSQELQRLWAATAASKEPEGLASCTTPESLLLPLFELCMSRPHFPQAGAQGLVLGIAVRSLPAILSQSGLNRLCQASLTAASQGDVSDVRSPLTCAELVPSPVLTQPCGVSLPRNTSDATWHVRLQASSLSTRDWLW